MRLAGNLILYRYPLPHQNADMPPERHLLLGLEVVEQDGTLLRLLTPVLNHDAGAVDDLARIALTVENAWQTALVYCSADTAPLSPSTGVLTETGPLAELLAIGNLDQGDLVLGAQGDDQLLVSLLLAGLVQDTHVSLAAVEGLGSLTETAGKTIVHESQLQDTLEGVENGHLALGSGIGGNLDLVGDGGGVVLFYVRLWRKDMSASVRQTQFEAQAVNLRDSHR